MGSILQTSVSGKKSTRRRSILGGGTSGSGSLKTTEGLRTLAAQSGFQRQSASIESKFSGESNNKLFSGGFISDFFDVLNALDYGVVGVLKGKGFSEGVKSRQSFADKDSLGANGIPGVIAGTVLDIAVDPLTYLAPWTLFKKIPGVVKVGKAAKTATFGKMTERVIEDGTGRVIQELEGGTTAGKFLAEKFSYMFGKDPAYRKMWERSERNLGKSATYAKKLTENMLDLPEDKFNALIQKGADFRPERASLEDLGKILSPEELAKAKKASDFVDELGQEMVRLGILDEATYLANKGRYLKAIPEKYSEKATDGIGDFFKKKIAGVKKRDELTEEGAEAMNYVKNPAYIFAKTTMDMIKDIENAKFFKEVAGQFATDVEQKGFTKVTQGNLGALSNKFIPEGIHKDLTELVRQPGDFEKALRRATSEFKFFKVVLNPASNVRNIISNKLLNYFDEAGMPLYRLDMDYGGLQSFLKKDEWYREVEELGGAVDTFHSQEIGNLLDISGIGKIGGNYNKFKEFIGGIYQGEEMMAKMSMYKYQRIAKKLPPEEAWAIAERATFNYAQVTPFVRKLRSNLFGFPFITFTVKSAPVVAKTVGKSPTKISNIGKAKLAIERMSDQKETEAERAVEPGWVKNGFYMKLPFKDDKGRSAYFDLTYILPFGDLAMLGDENATNPINKSPALSLIRDLGNNSDFFGNQIWKESDPTNKKLGDLMRHLTKTALPPPIADQIPGGYSRSTGKRIDPLGRIGSSLEAERDNQRRSLMEEMARMVGMKVQPIVPSVQESMNEWNKKRAYETLLRENEVGRNYESFYVPKEK